MNINLNSNQPVVKANRKKPTGAGKKLFSFSTEKAKSETRRSAETSQISMRSLFQGNKTVKTEELYTFANQLATLLNAGVPLVSCLTILTQQTENKFFKSVIEKISVDVRSGYSLTHAFSKFPKIFPSLFTSMVRASEKGGNMAKVLKQLAVYLEEQNKMAKKIKSAMVYPKFVSGFFGLVLCAVLFGLVPKFEAIFAGFDAELPKPTQLLMALSDFLKDYLIFEIIFTAVLFFSFKQFKKTETGRYILDKAFIRLPVIGEVVVKSILSKFCRTFSILLQSGVSIIDSIDIAGSTTNNVHFTDAFQKVKQGVLGGETLNSKMGQNSIFPPMVVSMIATGEQSGALDNMLNSVSELYEEHVNLKISGLTSIIEPVMMVALGVVALIVIIALYLPIFHMGSVM